LPDNEKAADGDEHAKNDVKKRVGNVLINPFINPQQIAQK
jgi:phosphoribosylformylglycinamidine (FGAM) synthase PurS component